MNSDVFSGFVLAGGKSSRMKTDKAFLEIAGESFIEKAVKNLRNICENRVKVVLNQTQNDFITRIPAGVSTVFDVHENRGALGGIHAALKNCETPYALILAVDLPLVTSEVIEKLVGIMLSSNDFAAVVPRQTDGKLQPLCAVYHARYCLPPLENLMQENDSASVRDFLELIAPRYIAQENLTVGDEDDIFLNVNHPADFQSIG